MGTFLDRAVETNRRREALLKKLRSGQKWLVRHWNEGQGDEVCEKDQALFDKTMFSWDEMERELRGLVFRGCPIDGGSCDSRAPVVCTHCSKPQPLRSTVDVSKGPHVQGTLFSLRSSQH